MSNAALHEIDVLPDPTHATESLARAHKKIGALTSELRAARIHERALLQGNQELVDRQVMLTQEFEHRFVNGLQVIASLLSLQSRAASTDEAAAQLAAAAGRVTALGRVHHRLHLLDCEDHVQFEDYLRHLCDDLSNLLSEGRSDRTIVFEGSNAVMPSAIAIPLGFIANELITNSAKHGDAGITVRFETTSPTIHSLTVLDQGPGLPEGFNPANSKGLGMRIVLGLVKQIGGALHVKPYKGWPGQRITITFCIPKSAAIAA